MTDQEGLYQWKEEVARNMPHLSKSQATVLALWSFGMVLAKSCAITAVSLILSALLRKKENTIRQQLREFCYDAEDKKGKKRQEIDVEENFVPLLKWILSIWKSDKLALAVDATTLADIFVVLVVSVVYKGSAIPVAWKIIPANKKHAWRPEWLRMLRIIRKAVPKSMFVIVMGDRGLYARWLYKRIVRLGWYPFLRINNGGKFRPEGNYQFQELLSFVPKVGAMCSIKGTAFASTKKKNSQLNCTLIACWQDGCKDPWLILTNLEPPSANAAWYGLRSWIEQGFKFIKRAGFQWQNTRMTDPNRASRLWLAVSISTLWLLSVGSQQDCSSLSLELFLVDPSKKIRKKTQLRLVSIFRRGWVTIFVSLINHSLLPFGFFLPDPWPIFFSSPNFTTHQEVNLCAA